MTPLLALLPSLHHHPSHYSYLNSPNNPSHSALPRPPAWGPLVGPTQPSPLAPAPAQSSALSLSHHTSQILDQATGGLPLPQRGAYRGSLVPASQEQGLIARLDSGQIPLPLPFSSFPFSSSSSSSSPSSSFSAAAAVPRRTISHTPPAAPLLPLPLSLPPTHHGALAPLLCSVPPWAAVNLLALLPRFGQAWPPEHALLLLHLACAPRPGLQPRGQGQGAQVDAGEGPLADRVWVQPRQGQLYRPDLTVEQVLQVLRSCANHPLGHPSLWLPLVTPYLQPSLLYSAGPKNTIALLTALEAALKMQLQKVRTAYLQAATKRSRSSNGFSSHGSSSCNRHGIGSSRHSGSGCGSGGVSQGVEVQREVKKLAWVRGCTPPLPTLTKHGGNQRNPRPTLTCAERPRRSLLALLLQCHLPSRFTRCLPTTTSQLLPQCQHCGELAGLLRCALGLGCLPGPVWIRSLGQTAVALVEQSRSQANRGTRVGVTTGLHHLVSMLAATRQACRLLAPLKPVKIAAKRAATNAVKGPAPGSKESPSLVAHSEITVRLEHPTLRQTALLDPLHPRQASRVESSPGSVHRATSSHPTSPSSVHFSGLHTSLQTPSAVSRQPNGQPCRGAVDVSSVTSPTNSPPGALPLLRPGPSRASGRPTDRLAHSRASSPFPVAASGSGGTSQLNTTQGWSKSHPNLDARTLHGLVVRDSATSRLTPTARRGVSLAAAARAAYTARQCCTLGLTLLELVLQRQQEQAEHQHCSAAGWKEGSPWLQFNVGDNGIVHPAEKQGAVRGLQKYSHLVERVQDIELRRRFKRLMW
ncbi:hypothetical protein V8C86DRAFT_2551373 [Haematococcus lacustris]